MEKIQVMLLNESRLAERMAELRLDALVAASPENVTYLSGFWALPQWIRRGPQVYVFWPAAQIGTPEIITSTSTLDLVADQAPWVSVVRRYGEFHMETDPKVVAGRVDQHHIALREEKGCPDAVTALVAAITEGGLAAARIGVDESGFEQNHFEELKARLANVVWLPAAALLRGVRAVKTEVEIERLRHVAHIGERSIQAALAVATEGATEQDLARAFHIETIKGGGLPVLGCIGFGERSALPNVQPSGRSLKAGEIIRFDVGGRFEHYRADIARNAVLGEAPAQAKRLHHALLRGVQHACDIIRPGMAASRLFDEVVNVVRREGIAHYRRDHVGHGIGLDGYDAPSLSPHSTEVLEEGMVLCVETPYYELGHWGLQVEDMVVVRNSGIERLMLTDGNLIEVPL